MSDTPKTAAAVQLFREAMDLGIAVPDTRCVFATDMEAVEKLAADLQGHIDACRGLLDYDNEHDDKPLTELIGMAIRQVVRLKKALELIAQAGGTTTEDGLSCNGSWAAEQARRTLEANIEALRSEAGS